MTLIAPGFTNPENTAIRALGYWGDRIYAGTSNSAMAAKCGGAVATRCSRMGLNLGTLGPWGAVCP